MLEAFFNAAMFVVCLENFPLTFVIFPNMHCILLRWARNLRKKNIIWRLKCDGGYTVI